MRKPWDQMPGEPDRAYGLFDEFLSMGPARSLRKLADTGVASLPHLKKLSAQWNWQQRAAAWQAEVARAHRSPTAEDLEAVREQQVRDARMLRGLARAQMRRWVEQSNNGQEPLGGQFSSGDLVRMWETGMTMDAQLRSLPMAREPEDGAEEEECPEFDPESCREPQEAMQEVLALAVAGGLPKAAASRAEELLWEVAAAVVTFAGKDKTEAGRKGDGR